jgi:hypothetical protein
LYLPTFEAVFDVFSEVELVVEVLPHQWDSPGPVYQRELPDGKCPPLIPKMNSTIIKFTKINLN